MRINMQRAKLEERLERIGITLNEFADYIGVPSLKQIDRVMSYMLTILELLEENHKLKEINGKKKRSN